MESLKRYVGKTPLLRAKNLEQYLGVPEIYMKLEGNNPSGYLEDRLAYLMLRDAVEKEKTTICMGTKIRIMYSLAFLSRYFNINCVFYVTKLNRHKREYFNKFNNVKVVEYGRTTQDCLMKSNEDAERENWYNGNIGKENDILYNYTYSYLAKEINSQLGSKLDSVFCQTGQGSSIIGLYWGFKQLWIDEEISTMPKLFACTSSKSLAYKLFADINNRDNKGNIAAANFSESMYNLQEFANAILNSKGDVIGLNDEELTAAKKKVQELENIKLSSANALPLAALFRKAEEGKIKKGVHVIILKDGRVELDISNVGKNELPLKYIEFVNLLHVWLNEYTDPVFEINEALEKAFEDGHVLCAYQNGELVGITVLIKTGFEQFFPRYHLAYIATKKDIKGRGIGTQLLKKAVEITGGHLSLHVDTKNANAVKLYEKIGFKKKYFRMIYEGVDKV